MLYRINANRTNIPGQTPIIEIGNFALPVIQVDELLSVKSRKMSTLPRTLRNLRRVGIKVRHFTELLADSVC